MSVAFLQYMARLCCDSDSDDDEFFRGRNLVESPVVVESSTMSRPAMPSSGTGSIVRSSSNNTTTHNYQQIGTSLTSTTTTVAESERFVDEDRRQDNDSDDDDDNCCCHGKTSASSRHEHGLQEFFRNIRERWRRYDSMETFRPIVSSTSTAKANLKAGLSPLRTASSYDASLDIPTISLDEVVLPGSELQKQMARAVSLNLEAQGDECVICMEGFEPTNPRMPTQCGCGRNKTYFHLPCLYQWVEQSEECPSCRQKLRWEEFQ